METASQELHRLSVVVDTHIDTLLNLINGKVATLGARSDYGHVDFPRLKEGGVNIQFFAAFIEPQYKPERGLKRALQMIDAYYREVEKYPDLIRPVTSYPQMLQAVGEGKIAAVLSIEGGEAVAGDLAVLRCLYRLGVRAIGLTWNERNDIADGVGERESGGGLTRFGRDLVREMNRLGMLVDVSHLSEKSFWDVLAVAKAPIIASHSNAQAVCPHPRNLTDDQIKALAANGGVMGLNFCPDFIDAKEPTQARLLDHAEHIISLVGPDHLGIGSDYDGISSGPVGLEEVTKLPNLTAGLLERGHSPATVQKILGENYLRVFAQVFSR